MKTKLAKQELAQSSNNNYPKPAQKIRTSKAAIATKFIEGYEHRPTSQYYILTVGTVIRQLESPILLNQREVTSYSAYQIEEYVDVETGEIIPAADLHDAGLVKEPFHYAEMALRRVSIVKSLRSEVRSFANFVLKFKNKWRGLTPGMKTLVKWYALLEGKRSQDVQRYVKRLEEVGICIGDTLLAPFQLASETATRQQLRVTRLAAECLASFMCLLKTRSNHKLITDLLHEAQMPG